MASNHYLRYKYYLCTRMVAEELYIAIKDIFASLELKQGTKVSPSSHAEVQIGSTSAAELSADLAELLKICLQIEGTGDMQGNFKTSPSEHTELHISDYIPVEQLPKLDGAHTTKLRHNLDFTFEQTAKVLKHIFYPVIEPLEHYLNFVAPYTVAKAARTEFSTSHSVSASVAVDYLTPIDIGIESSTTGEIWAQTSVAVPVETQIDSTIFVPCEPNFELLQAHNINNFVIKGIGNLGMQITMYRITKLSDYDATTLASMDDRSLADLDIIEQI